jgi:hypothetical protein
MHAHADTAQSMWVSAAVVRMKGVLRNKEAYAKDKVCVCLCGERRSSKSCTLLDWMDAWSSEVE